jgi:hypothetical protein
MMWGSKPASALAAPGLSRDFPTMRLYSGEPWFMPAVVRYYALRDSLPF